VIDNRPIQNPLLFVTQTPNTWQYKIKLVSLNHIL
jgi:hypothetical protein